MKPRGYITRAESTEQSVDYETQKKEKEKKEDAMVQNDDRRSPALLRASFLMMGIAIIGTGASTTRDVGQLHMNDTRSGQAMGDPTRPPHMNDTRSGQVMGDPTRPPHMNDTRSGQVMGDPTRPPHMNDTRSAQVMGAPTRPPHMNDTRSGQVMGDPTRPPHINDTRSGQVMGDPTRPPHMNDTRSGQVMGDPTRPPHMNDTSHGQVMGDPTRVAKRTVARSLEERIITMIPRVGGLFQLFSSPHLYGPISEALRHLGKRDATEGINLHRAKRFAPSLTTEWNKIHSGTCETDKACSVISMCTDDNTCYPQGRIIFGCVAVLILICSVLILICSACICCPCRGLMGC
jgi:hypothetical protein